MRFSEHSDCENSILLHFALVTLIFELLEVESSSNLKQNANAELKSALAQMLLSDAIYSF